MTNLELQSIGYWVTTMLLLAALLWTMRRDSRHRLGPPKGAIVLLAVTVVVFLTVATDNTWGWITG